MDWSYRRFPSHRARHCSGAHAAVLHPKHLADKILTTRSALQGERKHVTVLFADVAGFSPLAERLEPDDLHQLMDGCFALLTDTVHHYEGTINQYTGDGIMALFGAPIMHEDHAVRALHAALDVQAALRGYGATVQQQWGVPFQLRLGLHTGVVVGGRIGDDLRMDYTAQGDTVNLAARMQQQAPPGAIWVTEATYRLTSATFVWKELGALPIRGRSRAVTGYKLRGRQTSRSRAILRAIHADNELALAYASYGQWYAQYSDITRARDYLTQALDIFERLGTLGEPDKVRQVLAALPAA